MRNGRRNSREGGGHTHTTGTFQTRCFSLARTRPSAEAPSSTRTGWLFTNFDVRRGNPFKADLACFTGLAGSRLATTASAEPAFLVAFAATLPTDLLTDLAEITDFVCFEFMRSGISHNRAKPSGV